MMLLRAAVSVALAAIAFAASTAPSAAAILWDETVSGDLSDAQTSPTALVLVTGTNSILGAVDGDNDLQDFVSVTVPEGTTLDSVTLAAYVSPDLQGFLGVQVGPTFVGSPFVAGSFAGYAHYGTAAQNGSYPATNLVGANMLPIMADPAAAPGATGLTVPLGPGTYTFLIQQFGDPTNYQFDYVVVPEPASLLLLVSGIALLASLRRRRPSICAPSYRRF